MSPWRRPTGGYPPVRPAATSAPFGADRAGTPPAGPQAAPAGGGTYPAGGYAGWRYPAGGTYAGGRYAAGPARSGTAGLGRRSGLRSGDGARQPAPEEAAGTRGYGRVTGWIATCYGVTLGLYLAWAYTRSTEPDPSCLGVVGSTCPTARAEALDLLVTSLPHFVAALAVSVATAMLVRYANPAWKAGTVALVSAVVGGGMITVVWRGLGAG